MADIFAQNSPYNPIAATTGLAATGADKYPNPFCDIASAYIPTDLNEILEWSEYLMLTTPPFKSVYERVARYFLTEVVVEGASDKEREKYEDFIKSKLHIIQQLAEIGDDYFVYGNSFVSIYFPFDRWLICPKCGTQYHIETQDFKFNRKEGAFYCDCKKCGSKNIRMKHEDRRSVSLDKVKIIRWNPKSIKLRVHPISGKTEYYLILEQDFVEKVCRGEPFYINQTPWGMVEACIESSKNSGQALFKFNDDSIYHLKTGSLAGVPIKGWGIPPIMPFFKLAYYVQLLRRYDEAIAMDFIVPFRILFPQNTAPGGQDALTTISMNTFISAMSDMVKRKRQNITDIQVAPFSIGYELLGGEAKGLAPKDSIAQAQQELLNAMGFPQELFAGTLSLQAAPVALRLFEKQYNALVDGYNDIIAWMFKRFGQHFLWGEATGSLRSVTLADDLERKGLALQAAAGMDISKQTAYRPLGIDYMEEQKRVLSEQQEIQRLQQEAMKEQQVMQENGSMGESGGPGGQPGATPGDVYEQAGALAEQLLLQTPETMRRGELIKIKHSNPTLHALVLQRMDEMRQDMARQGQAQVMEQMKQASALPSLVKVQLDLSDQIMDYSRKDLRKIAMDIKNNVKGAQEAFHYIWPKMMGWE
jgi:hypothetical protein